MFKNHLLKVICNLFSCNLHVPLLSGIHCLWVDVEKGSLDKFIISKRRRSSEKAAFLEYLYPIKTNSLLKMCGPTFF